MSKLTKEMIQDALKCSTQGCCDCKMKHSNNNHGCQEALAQALLEEMDKPKVWDNAPDWAAHAYVQFSDSGINWTGRNCVSVRTIVSKKTIEREIAEDCVKELYKQKPMIDTIEQALIKARKEWEDGR
jgi:hypothetical protein